MDTISWMERKTNEEVITITQERSLLKTIGNRRGTKYRHLISHDSFFRSIIEEKIERKRERKTETNIFRLDTRKS